MAIDVDGVLANQIVGVLPIAKEQYGCDLVYEDVTDWALPIKDTNIKDLIIREQKQRKFILDMPVHLGAREVVGQIIQKHHVAIATARSPDSDVWTIEWLNQNGISFDEYTNSKEGNKQNASIKFDVLIDDYIGNIREYLRNHDGKAILFSQPWNQNREDLSLFIDAKRLVIATEWSQVPVLLGELLNYNS